MGKLLVVATPIGNLEDITLRALEVLKKVDLIVCEDTRHSKILLNKYTIKTPAISYHQHSHLGKIKYIIKQLEKGKDIALITDAGTPGIADPGQRLISEAVKNKIEIVAIPGASALTAALSISGFKADKFYFLGFLPKKKGREKILEKIKKIEETIIIYESPFRIKKTLSELQLKLNNPEVLIVRELTKKFEETYRGKISEVIDRVKPKGEIIIIIKNKK